jgi:ABC-type multidrug transport system ATPase subunit
MTDVPLRCLQVAQPSLLFLDEPTSGLDSTSSQAVLNGLKLLSHRGMSSIMVIHQPRYTIFELFDQVVLPLVTPVDGDVRA